MVAICYIMHVSSHDIIYGNQICHNPDVPAVLEQPDQLKASTLKHSGS